MPAHKAYSDPKLVTRLDSILGEVDSPAGFYNPVTGLGTGRDKTTYTTFGTFRALDTATLAAMYHGHDLSARVVDVLPDEELRLPFCLEIDSGEEEAEEDPLVARLLKKEFKRLKVRDHLLEGRKLGRLFGGAATILGANDGLPAYMSLDPTRVRQIDWLRTIDRRYLWPHTYYTTGEKNGRPRTYFLNDCHPGSSESFEIHESRLILWPGVFTAQREKDHNWSWDHSILDRCWSVLKMFETLYKGVELLITDGPQAVYKVKGLIDQIAAGQEADVMTRFEVIDTMRSILRAVVIDADGGESFERQQVTYSGTPEILTQMQLRLSSAVQIPMMVLFGQAPGGLGVTGENDLRWFFDRTAASQQNILAPRIEQIADLVLATSGHADLVGSVEVEFKPLWTPSELEQAQTRAAIATADKAWIDGGVITPEETGLSRFGVRGELRNGWKAYDRAAREKILKDVLSSLLEGSEPGAAPTAKESATTDPLARTDFDPDQERDESGRWASTGAAAPSGEHYKVQTWTQARGSEASRRKIEAERSSGEKKLANKPENFKLLHSVKVQTAQKLRDELDRIHATTPYTADEKREAYASTFGESTPKTEAGRAIATAVKAAFREGKAALPPGRWARADLAAKVWSLVDSRYDPEFNGGVLLSEVKR
jgi:hypothetical protein